jgi:hypothetical protein
MIEIKGNFGKSVIFEKLMLNPMAIGLVVSEQMLPIVGDRIYAMNDPDATTDDIIQFGKEYFNYEYNTLMVYSNWDYVRILPFIEWCKQQSNYKQCIVFYRQ